MTITSMRPITAAPTGLRADPACAADKHGTDNAYANFHCRCPEAREAWRLLNKRRRYGRHQMRPLVNPVGTSRRLRALAVAGWPTAYLADRLGVHRSRVERLRRCTTDWVTPATAAAVRALTFELADRQGPSQRSRDAAKRLGWLSLAVWDDIDDPAAVPDAGGGDEQPYADLEAISRVLAGRLPFKALHDVEKAALFRDHLPDWSKTRLAEHLHVANRTVEKWLERVAASEQVAA